MKNRSPFFYFLLLCGLILIWVSSNISWGKDHYKGILESDAKGYYAYLPATFVYHDLNYGFFDSIEKSKYYDEHYFYDYTTGVNGKRVNRYWCGTAICELPFFLAAHLYTIISGGDADGYSKAYPIAINVAAIFYVLLGLIFLNKLLKLYEISERNRIISSAIVLFGTNLFYYVIGEPGMSHVFAFAVISGFLYFIKSAVMQFSFKKIYFAAVLLGLAFLIRPMNILSAGLVFFIAGRELPLLLRNFFSDKLKVIVSILILLLVMSGQAVLFKIAAGHFIIDSYPGEHFNFSNPHFFEILFSYRKGLFLYTPLYLIMLLGLIFTYKKDKWMFWSFSVFFIVLTYVFSSWWSWWFGGSFSGRTYIDFLPAFSLLFALMLQNCRPQFKKVIVIFSVLLLFLCQFQTYQYRYDIIHWDGMTKEKYWEVFLRFNK